jgi:hypothetical protein
MPGQYSRAVFFQARRLSTSSGQNGKIRHWVGLAGWQTFRTAGLAFGRGVCMSRVRDIVDCRDLFSVEAAYRLLHPPEPRPAGARHGR